MPEVTAGSATQRGSGSVGVGEQLSPPVGCDLVESQGLPALRVSGRGDGYLDAGAVGEEAFLAHTAGSEDPELASPGSGDADRVGDALVQLPRFADRTGLVAGFHGEVDGAGSGAGQHRTIGEAHGRRARPFLSSEPVLDERDGSIDECLVHGHQPTVNDPDYAQ